MRPYRALFAEPVLRRLAAADVCARLPQGMVTITLLLVAAQHASMTVAGLVVAAYTLGMALTAPLRGRLADRYGLIPVAAACGIGYALALLGLLFSALSRGPAGTLVATATLAGLLNPPLSPGMRSLWSAHAGARLKQTAFALDAAVFDLAYITGPVVASALATGIVPAAALALLLALTGAATVIISQAQGPRKPPEPQGLHGQQNGQQKPRELLGPLRSTALRELLVTAALTNAALSATEVALTAYVRHHHALWASGPLLAEVSIGSIAGSLLLGARATPAAPTATPAARRLPRLLTGYATGLAVLTAAGLYPPLLAVAAPLAGLCLGSTLATLFGAAASAAPRGAGAETQAWLNSIMNGGAAAGAALAGLVAARPILALGLAAVTAATAAAASVAATAVTRTHGHDRITTARSDKKKRPMEARP
jgi:MFS family permease